MHFFQKKNLIVLLLGSFFSFLNATESEIPADLQAAKYITLIEKNDGFGCQLIRRMSAIAFAEYHHKTYVHLPINKLQHNYDNDINFADNMESFANMGMGCLIKEDLYKDLFFYGGKYWGYFVSLSTDIGRKLNQKQDLDNIRKRNMYYPEYYDDYSFNNPTSEDLNLLLSENQTHPFIYAREDYLYYTGKNMDAYFNKDVIELLRNRFFSSKKEPIVYFENNNINVAVHIRRGDVSPQANPDEYFLSIIGIIRKRFPNSVFHIFSEGTEKQFIKFVSKDIRLHLNEDIQMTFNALVAADVLVTSKSCFSYSAAILSKGIIYNCPKFWYPKLNHWIEIK